MNYFECKILGKKIVGESEYFEINCLNESKKYIIPVEQLLKFDVKVGETYFFEKKQNPNSKKFFLEFIQNENQLELFKSSHYLENKVYEFQIIKFEKELNKKDEIIQVVYVQDLDKNIIKVSCLKWQNESIWHFKNLLCLVSGFSSEGVPRLINKDNRHPIYEINKEYLFKVIKQKEKVTETGTYKVLELLGEDGCIHEANLLPIQNLTSEFAENIKCRVINITTKIRLLQVDIKDPFYLTFDKIIPEKKLQTKYFTHYFEEKRLQEKDEFQLVEQYNSYSAFWVFTYANKILPKLLKESNQKLDYKTSKEINQLIISFEEWILNKGIITSFPSEERREFTTYKAKQQLESSRKIDFILNILISNPYYYITENEYFKNKKDAFFNLYYLITFSKIEIIDIKLLIERLQNLLKNFDKNSKTDTFHLNGLLKYISRNKKTFISEEEKENFSLSSIKTKDINFTSNEDKYIIWTYGELLISKVLLKTEHSNILIGQLLKLYTKSTSDIIDKEKLLYSSYFFFENYQNTELKNPFVYDKSLIVNYTLLPKKNIVNSEVWSVLEENFNHNTNFKVILTKKSNTGYEANFNGLKGFLPYHHIKDRILKTYPFEVANFEINAKCISTSKQFNFFIIEQTNITNLENNITIKNDIVVGEIYDAIVKSVESYGIFLTTSIGEGLLYKKEIFDFNWNYSNISDYFHTGQKIKVVLQKINSESKLEFNFYNIKKTLPLYYDDYVERIFSYNIDDLFESNVTLIEDTYFEIASHEKAFCIEQYAVLQLDFDEKLKSLQVAKQFYTNAKNARSFLINIYISYFEILLKIKLTIENGNFENISTIKINAEEIKEKINKRTIETFPDSDKLIYFLDIISKFNEKTDFVLNHLFEYIKKYSKEKTNVELKTIAKITLANNLLLSESKIDTDFSLKNLRLIYDYISNGILSLEETIEDKHAREVKEELLIWAEKIKEEESETLEFKSSLFTPIPDEKKLKRLEELQKIEKLTEANKIEISKINGDLAKKAVIHSALKTLVAFANHKGGSLLIGVDDHKKILGLEREYKTLAKKDQNRDGFGKYFDALISTYIGDSFSSLMERKTLKFPEGDVLIVNIKPSNQEVFLLKNEEGKDVEQLYIRNLSSSKELIGTELVKFIKNRQ